MKHRVQNLVRRRDYRPGEPSSLRLRWIAALCLLLFTAISTAEAAHVHAPAQPGHRLQAPLPGAPVAPDGEHCPLCVAMHPAALPSALHIPLAPALAADSLPECAAVSGVRAGWTFALLSRPPPRQNLFA